MARRPFPLPEARPEGRFLAVALADRSLEPPREAGVPLPADNRSREPDPLEDEPPRDPSPLAVRVEGVVKRLPADDEEEVAEPRGVNFALGVALGDGLGT